MKTRSSPCTSIPVYPVHPPSRMEHIPLDELRSVHLRFCTSRDIAALRSTSRTWSTRIPFSWVVDDVYITDRLDLNSRRFFTQMGVCIATHGLDTAYPFLQRLTIVNAATLCALDIPLGSTRLLESVTLTTVPALRSLRIRSTAQGLHDVFCNNAPALQTLDISPDCTQLQSLLVSGSPDLKPFVLAPTWTQLRHLGLVNVNAEWTRLLIPSGYVHLKSVNLSGSSFTELVFYPWVSGDSRVCVQAHNLVHVTRLRVRTVPENHNRLWITTSLPLDVECNLKSSEHTEEENKG
jgi:hypothetical protein